MVMRQKLVFVAALATLATLSISAPPASAGSVCGTEVCGICTSLRADEPARGRCFEVARRLKDKIGEIKRLAEEGKSDEISKLIGKILAGQPAKDCEK